MTDVLILGSGIGGLSSAITLARMNYRVTVIEKNPDPGGLMRGYSRGGVDCPVGVHYLGSLGRGQSLRRLFDFMGVSERIPVEPMGTDGVIDRYIFDDFSFDLPPGIDAFEESLGKSFPRERGQIAVIMKGLRETAERLHRLDFLYDPAGNLPDFDLFRPMGEIFAGLGCSPGLCGVLGVSSYLLGVPVFQCPAIYYYMTLSSYLYSSWRLRCSSADMADAFAGRLRELGGEILCGDPAESILINGRAAAGAVLRSGREIPAPIVIAAVHPAVLLPMLPQGAVRPIYRKKLLNLADTGSIFSATVGLDASAHEEIGHNIYRLRCRESGEISGLMYLQVRGSAKRDMNVLSMIQPSDYEDWEQWKDTVSGRRGEEYREKKRAIAGAMMKEAETILGPLHGARTIDTYSPLTLRDWVSTPRGSTYGVLRSAGQLLKASSLNRTPVEGLYLAGQSVQAPGILGTIIGSLMTVNLITGPERFRREVLVGV